MGLITKPATGIPAELVSADMGPNMCDQKVSQGTDGLVLSGKAVLGRRVEIAGVDVDNVSMDEAIARIEEMIRRREPSYVVTPNADHVVRFHKDAAFRRAYQEASLVLADGISVVWGARLLGTPLKEKVSGSDLFPRFAPVAAQRGYRLAFLGGRPGAAQQSAEVLQRRCPGLQVVQVCCPRMGFECDEAENGKIVQAIRDSGADVLFVGLGSPKQELWIHKHRWEYRVPVSIGIGGTFEFISGQVPRAPRFIQKAGLEWLWRLVAEPRRMYRRYLMEDPEFFRLLWRQWRFRTAKAGERRR
jgi:N-acetylglucosaminyldiphosphoundecaprenol N-acetyl-beta-D-mannosaminyltransferase